MPLKITPRLHGNVYVIRCAGRIVLGDEARALEAALEVGAQQTRYMILSLAEVDRLDSIGLGLLIRFCTRLGRRGGDLRMAAAPPAVTALLRLTALTKVFKLFATEEQAVASFRKLGVLPRVPAVNGTRLLIFDPSPDLCVFVRSVLACRGFAVRSATNLQEARHLIAEEDAEVLLIGPGTAQVTAASTATSFSEWAPDATVLRLPSDFKCMDAQRATETLLALFGSIETPAFSTPSAHQAL